MPGNILNADTGFPQFTGDESSDAKIDKVMNYLYMLLEQLRYSLNNLDADNFNDAGLREIGEGIARPLQTSFENEFSKTNALIEGISNEFGSQIQLLTDWVGTDADGNLISSAASITAVANKNKSDIALLTQRVGEDESALAEYKISVGNTYATASSLTTFQNSVNKSITEINQNASAQGALIELVAYYDTDNNPTLNAASIALGVSKDKNFINLIAEEISLRGFVTFASLENDGEAYINGNNIGLVSNSDGDSTASLRFWLEDDISADEDDYLIGEIYTSGTDNYLEACTLHIKTGASNMKITSGGDLGVSSAMALSIESGTSYVEIIADGSVEIYSGDDTLVDCDYMTILPSVSHTSSREVAYAWQFFDDGIYFNGYKMVSTPS